jgi:ferrochelatase
MVMAYGSPRDDSELEAYYTHIRGGRPPSPEPLAELRERYRAIGGSPLLQITRRQAAALEDALGMPVFAAMKHSPPFIESVAGDAAAAGVKRLVGLPLAPHYAALSFDGYRSRLEAAWPHELVFIAGFHRHPAFVAAVRAVLIEAMIDFEPEAVYFTAHSLPARSEASAGYRERLLESAGLVAAATPGLAPWRLAFQSASATGEPWLGPDLLEALAGAPEQRLLVCPVGFVADHLEILYDLDVEAHRFARERGLDLRRTASFNDRPEFIEALAAVVRDQYREEPEGRAGGGNLRSPAPVRGA